MPEEFKFDVIPKSVKVADEEINGAIVKITSGPREDAIFFVSNFGFDDEGRVSCDVAHITTEPRATEEDQEFVVNKMLEYAAASIDDAN